MGQWDRRRKKIAYVSTARNVTSKNDWKIAFRPAVPLPPLVHLARRFPTGSGGGTTGRRIETRGRARIRSKSRNRKRAVQDSSMDVGSLLVVDSYLAF